MKDEKLDLTFVDPHRRQIVAERIEAVQRFNRSPGRASAEREAAALGISAGRFYLIVKAWNTHRDASRLPGANRHRMDARVPDTIRDEIARLIASDPRIIPERVIEGVTAFANARGLDAPSGPTIADEVNRQRRGKLPMLEQNVNYVVDHCHLAIPVASIKGAMSVTLSGVIDVEAGAIMGTALTLEEPGVESTAGAISDAARAGRLSTGASILIDRPRTEEWSELITVLEEEGLAVMGDALEPDGFHHDRGILRKRGNGRLLRAVAGRYISGYRMAVRTRGSHSRPAAKPKAGSAPFELMAAERLVRSRLTEGTSDRPVSGFRHLVDELERIKPAHSRPVRQDGQGPA